MAGQIDKAKGRIKRAVGELTGKSGTGRWTMYPWAFIRVTNRRILLSQGGLFGKKHVLRFIIAYEGPKPHEGEDASPASILKSGRQQWTTDREHIQLDQEKDLPILRILPPSEDVEWFQISEVILYPSQPEPYVAHLIKNTGKI
ncbi:MAG: hypothetical protein K8R69_02600 [Deltaproteobacteria bacterium]|nr:hypothetical protein [Deltaproteobacteria bacterium]